MSPCFSWNTMKLTLLLFLHSCWMKAQELLAFDPSAAATLHWFLLGTKSIFFFAPAPQQLFPHNLYVAHFSHLHAVVNCAKVHCRLVQLVYAAHQANHRAAFCPPSLHLCKCSRLFLPSGVRQLYIYSFLFWNSPPNLSVIFSELRTGANFFIVACRRNVEAGVSLRRFYRRTGRDSTPVARAWQFFSV